MTEPAHLCCPVSLDLLRDPVMAADGFTYEREAIKRWLETHDTSPQTNDKLPHRTLTPNIALRQAVKEWVAQRDLRLEPSRVVIDREMVLGHGSFGAVFGGTLDRTTRVAVKCGSTRHDMASARALFELEFEPHRVRFADRVSCTSLQFSNTIMCVRGGRRPWPSAPAPRACLATLSKTTCCAS